jgi:hypothetical protein
MLLTSVFDEVQLVRSDAVEIILGSRGRGAYLEDGVERLQVIAVNRPRKTDILVDAQAD